MLLTHQITIKSADEMSSVPNSNMKLPSTCSRASVGVLFDALAHHRAEGQESGFKISR